MNIPPGYIPLLLRAEAVYALANDELLDEVVDAAQFAHALADHHDPRVDAVEFVARELARALHPSRPA